MGKRKRYRNSRETQEGAASDGHSGGQRNYTNLNEDNIPMHQQANNRKDSRKFYKHTGDRLPQSHASTSRQSTSMVSSSDYSGDNHRRVNQSFSSRLQPFPNRVNCQTPMERRNRNEDQLNHSSSKSSANHRTPTDHVNHQTNRKHNCTGRIRLHRGRRMHANEHRGSGNQRQYQQSVSESTGSSKPCSSSQGSRDKSPSASSSNSLEIPGFYYDQEKKKYFKILPGHQSANSKMLTREIIKLKKAEEARQESLREFALKTIRMDPSYVENLSAQKPRCHFSRNITDQVNCIHTGVLKTQEIRLHKHRLLNHKMQNLKPFCKRKVYGQNDGSVYKRLEHMTQMCVVPGDSSRILCLWSLEGLIVQRIQLVKINEVAQKGPLPEGSTMSVAPVGAVLLQSFSKVTHICWAPSSMDQTVNVPVLYTTTCFMGNSPSLALLRLLEGERDADTTYAEFHLGHTTTWTCAWSTPRQKFSIGTNDSALVIDVATRRMWELFTKKSDVYSQTFNHSDGNVLYSGTKKGVIVGHDLRSNSTRYISALHHKSPLCHLHLLSNDSHLLAADYSGRLCMWDLRMRSVVQDYIGHNNEYVRLPFKVDDTESLVCGVGQDCYTRLWDLQTGKLLTSIPPPYPASRDLIPSVTVYSEPRGCIDRPGVLMGIKDELHFFS